MLKKSKGSVMIEVKPAEKAMSYKVMLDENDRARLAALAESYAISQGAVVRMLVKRDADARGIVVKSKPTKRSK